MKNHTLKNRRGGQVYSSELETLVAISVHHCTSVGCRFCCRLIVCSVLHLTFLYTYSALCLLACMQHAYLSACLHMILNLNVCHLHKCTCHIILCIDACA